MPRCTCAGGLLVVALIACEGSPATPGKDQQPQGDFPIATSSLWEWGSSAATDGSNYLVATWRGDSTIVNVYPTATLGTVSVQLVSGTGALQGSPLDLSQTPGDGAGIVFDGTNYVVLYTSGPQATSTVNVQFVSRSGARVGSPLALGGGYLAQDIGYGGGTYLFTYTRQGVSSNVGYARTLSAGGTLGPELLLAAEPGGAGAIAFDGSNFAVAYHRGGASKVMGLKFVSPAGQVVKDVPIASSVSVFSAVGVAYNGSNFLVAWDESGQSVAYHVQALRSDGSLMGTEALVTVPGGVRMLGVEAIGANFLVEYADRTGGLPYHTEVQEYSASGTAIGGPVEVKFSDGTSPRAAALIRAATGQRVFALLTSSLGKTWDVYGRFIPVP